MYCWSYAAQWHAFQQREGIPQDVVGPIFISIGSPEKLETFLQLNPTVPRNNILVDDYDHKLYKQLGFSRFDELKNDQAGDIKFKKLIPNLGIASLFSYATRFIDMVPTEGDLNWRQLPEGGLRNGGTLVVKKDDVIYQWSDKVPSDVPDITDVVNVAKDAAIVK